MLRRTGTASAMWRAVRRVLLREWGLPLKASQRVADARTKPTPRGSCFHARERSTYRRGTRSSRNSVRLPDAPWRNPLRHRTMKPRTTPRSRAPASQPRALQSAPVGRPLEHGGVAASPLDYDDDDALTAVRARPYTSVTSVPCAVPASAPLVPVSMAFGGDARGASALPVPPTNEPWSANASASMWRPPHRPLPPSPDARGVRIEVIAAALAVLAVVSSALCVALATQRQ